MTMKKELVTVTDQELILKTEGSAIIQQAHSISVADDETYAQATEFLVQLKKHVKSIKDDKESIYRPAKTVVDEITSRYKPLLDDASSAEKIVKGKIIPYVQEKERQERERIAREKREREEAALAEAQRFMDEFGAHADAAAKAARERAATLRAEGNTELADRFDAIAMEQESKMNEEAQKRAQKALEEETKRKDDAVDLKAKSASGQSIVNKVWTFKVDDISKVPAEFLQLDVGKVRAAMRDGRRDISGICIFQEDRISVR